MSLILYQMHIIVLEQLQLILLLQMLLLKMLYSLIGMPQIGKLETLEVVVLILKDLVLQQVPVLI